MINDSNLIDCILKDNKNGSLKLSHKKIYY